MDEQDYNEAMHLAGMYDGDVEPVSSERTVSGDRLRDILAGVVGTLNHTINQPLCVIIGIPDVVQMSNDPLVIARDLARIKEAGQKIDWLLQKISAYLEIPTDQITTKEYVQGSTKRLLDIDFD